MIRVLPLDSALDRAAFTCGVPALDQYFHIQATQDAKRLIARCFVALREDRLLGYYTLSSASVPFSDVPPSLSRRLPRYPALPAIRIGRLAVDIRHQGQGLGGVLLADAIQRALRAEAPGFSIVVDAKDAQAAAFYRHHGFLELPSRPLCLLLPLGTIRKLP
ncbi:GNAT family N-acetyltransferase [Solidesulfovibrio carbinolicus]|uniref:GNAT family N-acetyltransferase n=1 Tax=Solidesulfovibrio carbinolicus TaxID=296842 RepID=A0A4P6HFK7_9BACT|nr:GNAT family N-acetyltransferase [Solidesulfovibrio carbinolicus]QAZ65941.1 GNAT family N-acetyltransferase [Solidesulfovibrio carbinolicus]